MISRQDISTINRSPFLSQVGWGLSFAVILAASILQHTDWSVWGMAISWVGVFVLFLMYSSGDSVNRYGLAVLIASALFCYSIYTSHYILRSLLVSMNVIATVFFAFVLLDHNPKFSDQVSPDLRSQYQQKIGVLKTVLVMAVGCHCVSMIGEYVTTPDRVTGFFADYSQASLIILLAFGLAYPSLKRKPLLGYLVTFVFFLAFFTSFSRSASALLFLFLLVIGAYYVVYKRDQLFWCSTVAIIAVCYAAVYFYPLLINLESIDRGGISHFSTLNSRVYYWQAAIDAIAKKPLWGYGLGNYEWSGIKNIYPFTYIPSVHNDYLQIWLDLGLIWLACFVFIQCRFLIKHQPFQFGFLRKHWKTTDTQINEQHFIAWLLLALISVYMCINFVVSFFTFQLVIAMLICEVLSNETS